ncbi:MAG: helix-turn-helix transcriptional regulator [Lachnospiraceae bacterium]|nr:helix-turn-helix transcriptional regulator [Lachnospiraceae bacterium]
MENLKILRKKRNLSQLRLAMELGLSQQSIHKYETGKAEPDIRTLIELSRFFHVSVDYLIGNSETFDPVTQKKKKAQREPDISLHLTPAEYHYLSLYRLLSPKVRSGINLILEEMTAA